MINHLSVVFLDVPLRFGLVDNTVQTVMLHGAFLAVKTQVQLSPTPRKKYRLLCPVEYLFNGPNLIKFPDLASNCTVY